MIALKRADGGILMPVKVIPGASKNEICGEINGSLKVKITAAPEKGKANAELEDFLAGVLGVKRAAVEVVKGGKARLKSVFIRNISMEDALKILK